jgi:hypothetical protein
MSTVNLGRVQGGGFFASTSTSTTSISKSTIETTTGMDVSPLVGDVIVNANGDLLLIKSITTASYTTTKFGSIKGAKGDKGDSGSGGGNIGSYWAVIPNASIPTYYGDASISFSFTTNNGYDKNLIGAELKDILLAPSVNIYKTQTNYADESQPIDMSELCSRIYNGDGTADGKQIIKGKATIDTNGTMKDYDCLLFVYESGTDVYLTIGLVEEDKNSALMSRNVRLDQSVSIPTAGFFIGNS